MRSYNQIIFSQLAVALALAVVTLVAADPEDEADETTPNRSRGRKQIIKRSADALANPGEDWLEPIPPGRSDGGRKQIVKRSPCSDCPSCCEHEEVGRDKRSANALANPEEDGDEDIQPKRSVKHTFGRKGIVKRSPDAETLVTAFIQCDSSGCRHGEIGREKRSPNAIANPGEDEEWYVQPERSAGGRKHIVKRSPDPEASRPRPPGENDQVDPGDPVKQSGGGRKHVVKRSPDPAALARPTLEEVDEDKTDPVKRSASGRKQIVKREARSEDENDEPLPPSGGGRKQVVKRSPDPVARPTPGEDEDVIKASGDCGDCLGCCMHEEVGRDKRSPDSAVQHPLRQGG